jgi:hypothetical protein
MHQFIKRLEHLLEHAATVFVGFALVILGLGLTFSIVFALPGIIVLAIGVAIVAGGLFAHPTLRARRQRIKHT